MAISETAAGTNSVAVTGTATGDSSIGIVGRGDAVGVTGVGEKWHGVEGVSHGDASYGVHGVAQGAGVVGESSGWHGVSGVSTSAQGYGVYGKAQGSGVVGESSGWHGVAGLSESTNGGAAVWGEHKANGTGTVGKSGGGIGVQGVSDSGVGIVGKGGSLAGRFEGDVEVTGDIRLANADCAEDFDVAEAERIEPGTVMVLGDEGALHESQLAYDKRVAGVVSGAGEYRPGIVLDKQASRHGRKPIALLGKVYCKVDARYGAIGVGDMLTTSPTPGHGMRADDPFKAFGAVIGKALRPLSEGQGLIPILIALQ